MSASGADNRNNNANDNIICTIKDTKLYVLPSLSVFSPNARKCAKNANKYNSEYEHFFTQWETIKNYQNFLAKDLKDQFIGKNIKQKEMIRIQPMNLDIFSNQTLLELIDCLS